MGIRCDQMIGLNNRAEEFLDKHCQTQLVEVFIDGVKENEYLRRKQCEGKYRIGEIFGYYLGYDNNNKNSLLTGYELKDGTEVFEDVQWAESGDSGPCFFLRLVDENGSVVEGTDWTDKEMNDIL